MIHLLSPVLTFSPLSVLTLHPVPPPFYPSVLLLNNGDAVVVGMSQCSWGAGHLPSAHSAGTDGTARTATLRLFGANCAPRIYAELMLTHSGQGSKGGLRYCCQHIDRHAFLTRLYNYNCYYSSSLVDVNPVFFNIVSLNLELLEQLQQWSPTAWQLPWSHESWDIAGSFILSHSNRSRKTQVQTTAGTQQWQTPCSRWK